MLKSWMRDITLSLQAKSGVTPALFVWLAIVAVAFVTAFVFLCVAGYRLAVIATGRRLRRPGHGRRLFADRADRR